MHGPTIIAMTVTEYHQSQGNKHFNVGSHRQSLIPLSYHTYLYARTLQPGTICRVSGHNESICWINYPELKPQWMIDKEE